MSECNCNEGGICHPCYDAKCEENNRLTKDYYNSVCVIEELKEWLEGILYSELSSIHSATVLSKISELKTSK